ncbi:MAG: LysM peptidoglycan-binding domain-containing protein [Spirochaetia bacterium]|jgi:membrane-bound lytic murein transglycosylase D|nr:LysM peptidoglycan-binding domain-containing protein [Spirochaetia bacterium]
MKFSSIVSTLSLAALLHLAAASAAAYDPDDPPRGASPYAWDSTAETQNDGMGGWDSPSADENLATAGWDADSSGYSSGDAVIAPSGEDPSPLEEEPALPDYTGPQDEPEITEIPGVGEEAPETVLPSPAAEEASTDEPAGKVEAPEDFTPIVINPLMSAGIFVDGLEYDIEMPWGHQEFEELREFYLSAGGKKWLKTVMQRSLPYLAFVEEKIHELELPRELLYLPIIESEYSPYAVSRSGATGIWQFMRNSIDGYGLTINEWKDDRRDFMRSTTGALSKLRDNYKALGDWSLAIAAYNAGLGAVGRAVRNAKGDSIDFWHLYESKKLPKESLAYVPKFLAVASILRFPELHGVEYSWGDTLSWEAIELDRQVDIGLVAEKTGIDLDLLKRGNAELNYNITPPGKGQVLKVPSESAEAVKKLLADTSAPLFRYDIYTVKSGDTLSVIAKRYSTPLSIVIDANPGIKPDRIKIGQRLIIPHLSAAKVLASSDSRTNVVFDSYYTIKKGDTLGKISSLYSINPIVLADANNIGLNSILRIGQRLKVPKR